jgi:hypothetical protein
MDDSGVSNTFSVFDEDENCVNEKWYNQQKLIEESISKNRKTWKSRILDMKKIKHPKWGMNKPRRYK